MEIHSELVVVCLDALERLCSRLERLVGMSACRALEERQTHVPNEIASFNYQVWVSKSFVCNHCAVHQLQGLDSSLEILNLPLERIQLHACLWIDVSSRFS